MATRITEPPEERVADASRRQTPSALQRNLAIPHTALVEFCQRNQIRKLSLFGSVLRDDFGPESDIDILVEFEAGTHIGYFALSRMQRELTKLLERKVDLLTPASISRYFREQVLRNAQTQYEKAQRE